MRIDTKGNKKRKSKDRQHNGQKEKVNRSNNDLQNITQKANDQVTFISHAKNHE